MLMLYQSGIRNAVATLERLPLEATCGRSAVTLTRSTCSSIRTLRGRRPWNEPTRQYRLERTDDPDTVATATRLKLDLRVLRLTQDPADWLLDHSPEEFAEMLSGAVTLLEYIFRRKVERARGASAAERSRMMSEVRGLISRIDDPVFYREALRVAAEAMGVSSAGARERKETAGRRATPSRHAVSAPWSRPDSWCLPCSWPARSHREATGARHAGSSAARALQTRCQRLCD